MLVIFLCTKNLKVKVHIATVAPEFNVHTMAKTKVGKKQGAELCTVNILFKNNTRTKMFLLNQIYFLWNTTK